MSVIIAASSFVTYTRRESYVALYASLDPCKKAITYRVESVDKRFNLDLEEVVDYSKTAAEIWNKEYGRDLFTYSEVGDLSINMVFDERQQASNKISKLDKGVNVEKSKLDGLIKEHRVNVTNFKGRLAKHNQTVESWNSQGGAPEEEFKKLSDEQNKLESEADSLNKQAGQLNLANEDYNLQVGALNEAIDDFNQDLDAKPEEGLFIGEENRIEIYFNNNRDELIHTLAHELGHARGLDHNNNSKSVMYPFSTKVVTTSNEDIVDLIETCRSRSVVEVVRTRLNL